MFVPPEHKAHPMHLDRCMNRHYRIVASLDGSSGSEAVLEHTLAQAARHETPEIHLLAVARSEDDVLRLEDWLAKVVVGRVEKSAWRRPDWQTYTHVRDGILEEEIANFAGEVEADLIVIGRRGVPARTSPSDQVGLDARHRARLDGVAALRRVRLGS